MEITGIISAIIIGLVIGALGRLIGTGIAAGLGVADTGGIDWIELGIQVALAALGVSLAAGLYRRHREQRGRKLKHAAPKLSSR